MGDDMWTMRRTTCKTGGEDADEKRQIEDGELHVAQAMKYTNIQRVKCNGAHMGWWDMASSVTDGEQI